ncbi:molecular chaperone HtpG [Prosthecomicrobium pneumaticum]|uniref:Chaperone protein HtpG n=1 Tax=Prosthecomicrobium pneumaticum TaxID=81895 RepID=A0A7W9FMH4_9HYPH|nr:molecular chaperone HtpG [Prosthecomicrobium pneumaticum]MBB5753417.1 molecular chaperone HtpG [Prosthecomicrobium pneumaticum]
MSETAASETKRETRPFEAEVSRLLAMMVHSVYSNRDVFLRELVSNAADACEKLRQKALSDPALAVESGSLAITITADPAARRLTIADNGIGMDHDELVDNLGTIARSGTRAFVESLEEGADSNLIGRFGVGFYSAFMVAGRVEVVSRKAGAAEAWRWTSDGKGSFAVEPADPAAAPERGTRVVLDLLDDAEDYATEATIERIVTAHSAHVPVPIALVLEGGLAEKTLTDGGALWRKAKSAVTPEEYRAFYGHVGHAFDEPALTLHYRAEGRTEYSVLLFVPSEKPFDLFDPERRNRIKLYVRRVFVTEDAAILPPFLRFVRGVIDSEDLPLNISREMLQKNAVLDLIGKGVTNRLLSELAKLAESDKPAFEKIWTAFGPVLKEGLYEDPERRDALFEIVRFRTTKGTMRSLKDYVADLRPNQTEIYYALGADEKTILASPQLEGCRARGVEVLLLADPVDAFWVRTALGYDGKPFRSVTQGSAALDAIPRAEEAASTEAASDAAVATLGARLKQVLGDAVSEVRPSTRLVDSPVCLVAPEFGPDRHLERLLAGREGPEARKAAPVLELNPGHPIVAALAARAAQGGEAAAKVDETAPVLLGLAHVLEGDLPQDPAGFGKALSRLIADALA